MGASRNLRYFGCIPPQTVRSFSGMFHWVEPRLDKLPVTLYTNCAEPFGSFGVMEPPVRPNRFSLLAVPTFLPLFVGGV